MRSRLEQRMVASAMAASASRRAARPRTGDHAAQRHAEQHQRDAGRQLHRHRVAIEPHQRGMPKISPRRERADTAITAPASRAPQANAQRR